MKSIRGIAVTVATIPSLDDYSSVERYLQTPEPLHGLPLSAIGMCMDRCRGIMGLINSILEGDGHNKDISNPQIYIHYLHILDVSLNNIHSSIHRAIKVSDGWQPNGLLDRGNLHVVNLVYDGLNLTDYLADCSKVGPKGFPVNAIVCSIEESLSVITGMLQAVEDGEFLLSYESIDSLFYFLGEQLESLESAIDAVGRSTIPLSLGGAS